MMLGVVPSTDQDFYNIIKIVNLRFLLWHMKPKKENLGRVDTEAQVINAGTAFTGKLCAVMQLPL